MHRRSPTSPSPHILAAIFDVISTIAARSRLGPRSCMPGTFAFVGGVAVPVFAAPPGSDACAVRG
jgi:hypothetical protein